MTVSAVVQAVNTLASVTTSGQGEMGFTGTASLPEMAAKAH